MPPLAVPVTTVGPVAAASMVFRDGDVVHVAAIVKATFSFEHRGVLRQVAPEPIFVREAHRMNNPTRSIVATSDLVPRLPGVDVLLLGHAHAPGGSALYCSVRLALARGGESLIDKTIQVVGDRKGAELKSFQSMPLVFEKAFGGPGYRDNPLGTGSLSGDPLPNLVYPQAPETVACFAPLSRTWPARTSLLSAEVRAGLDRPVAEIPPGFDFRYFHAAPADQRTDHLLGEEWIVLEGVHPEHEQIQLQLPGAQAMVRVVGTQGHGRVFSLRADTLRIDADARRCTLVWRNSFPVRESELGELQLLAGVALPDVPITWPHHVEPRESRPALAAPAGAQTKSGTMIIEDGPPLATTFGGTMEVADEDLEAVQIDDEVPDFSSTTVLSGSPMPLTSPLPFEGRHVPAPPPPPPARKGRAGVDPKEATLDLSHDFAAITATILPFAKGRGGGGSESVQPTPSVRARASAPIPGAPWDPERGTPLGLDEGATFDAEAVDLSGTLASPGDMRSPMAEMPALVEPVMVAPPAMANPVMMAPPAMAEPVMVAPPAMAEPVMAPPAIAEPPAPVPAPVIAEPVMAPAPAPVMAPAPAPVMAAEPPKGDPWGQSLRDEPAAAPEVQAPKPAAPPAGLRSSLYKRFKK